MMPSDDYKPADEQAANDDDDLKTADEDEEGEEDSHEHNNRSIYMIDVDEKNIDPGERARQLQSEPMPLPISMLDSCPHFQPT